MNKMTQPVGGRKVDAESTVETYDRAALTYANSFDSFWTSTAIRAIAWLTGQLPVLRMVKKFERRNAE